MLSSVPATLPRYPLEYTRLHSLYPRLPSQCTLNVQSFGTPWLTFTSALMLCHSDILMQCLRATSSGRDNPSEHILCLDSRNTPAYIHFSFTYPAKLHSVYRTLAPSRMFSLQLMVSSKSTLFSEISGNSQAANHLRLNSLTRAHPSWSILGHHGL